MATMRDAFLEKLYGIASNDKRVVLLSADFGAPSLDRFRADLKDQFFHVGIAEQDMLNLAAGLAMEGRIVYVYAMSPFLPLRCLEQMKIHMALRGLPITAVAVGAGFSYELSGPTHHTLEDIAIVNAIPGVTLYSCSDGVMGAALASMTHASPGPAYVRFDREKTPDIYLEGADFGQGLSWLTRSSGVNIIATGIMVSQALAVSRRLRERGLDVGVADIYRLKPLNGDALAEIISGSKYVVTMEEAFLNGGIGSMVASFMADRGLNTPLKRLGASDQYFHRWGPREYVRSLHGLDIESATNVIGGIASKFSTTGMPNNSANGSSPHVGKASA